jgi:hypothetical protein
MVTGAKIESPCRSALIVQIARTAILSQAGKILVAINQALAETAAASTAFAWYGAMQFAWDMR